jgi:hypothetical protein
MGIWIGGQLADGMGEKANFCTVCKGLIKPWSMVIRCGCGKLYHDTCARRVRNCIMCERFLTVDDLRT